jgi:stage III sporulation protein AE
MESMKKQMSVVYPIMMTLMAACGNGVTVAVCRPAVGFFATAITTILCEIVMPLTLIIMTFSMVGNLTKTLKIGNFTAFFKSVNKWIIGVSVSVFGLFFTLQGITAASYDGVMRRAAKYAIGNGIPIIGGFLSGGFDLAVAGGVLIKNSLGSMGIFMMITVLLEPLILLISTSILFRLTAAITQPLGDGSISALLGETADNLRYCTACLLLVSFLYFLTILIMVCCTETMF